MTGSSFETSLFCDTLRYDAIITLQLNKCFRVFPTNFYVNLIYGNKCYARGLSNPFICCLRVRALKFTSVSIYSAVMLFRYNKYDIKK